MATAAALGWVSLALSAYGTYESGEVEKSNFDAKARAENSNAKSREIERKRALVNSLAARNVKQGASGVTGGSQVALMKADIRKEGLDDVVDAGATSERVDMLSSNATAAKNYSLLSSAGTITSGASRIKKRGTIKKDGD